MREPKLSKVCTTSENSAAISANEQLYIWGFTKNPALAFLPKDTLQLNTPLKLEPEKIFPILRSKPSSAQSKITQHLKFKHISMNENQIACILTYTDRPNDPYSPIAQRIFHLDWSTHTIKAKISKSLQKNLPKNLRSIAKFFFSENQELTQKTLDNYSWASFINALKGHKLWQAQYEPLVGEFTLGSPIQLKN
jgi:alpha-tubulin suppressor-like RCC1 family protein